MAQVDVDQEIKSQMEKVVDTYDNYMKRATFGREAKLRQVTVELAGVKPGDTVLEVGCGTGTLTLAAKKAAGASGKAFGIDIIPGMIEASQKKAAEAGEEIDFREGSIADITFDKNTFDVVLCSFMIFHMSEEPKAGASGKAFGIDIIPGMIDTSQKKAVEAGEEINFQEGSIADSLPSIKTPSMLCCASFMILSHDLRKLAREFQRSIPGCIYIFHILVARRMEYPRLLKPGGRWLILDLALPTQPIQRSIAHGLLGFSADDDLRVLSPLMESAGFTGIEYGTAKFRIFGLSLIGYIRGNAKKESS